jgi:hypothetical protein
VGARKEPRRVRVEVTVAAKDAAVRVMRCSPERAPVQVCEALQGARLTAQRTDTGADAGAQVWRAEPAWGCARLVVAHVAGAMRVVDVLPALGGDEGHMSDDAARAAA